MSGAAPSGWLRRPPRRPPRTARSMIKHERRQVPRAPSICRSHSSSATSSRSATSTAPSVSEPDRNGQREAAGRGTRRRDTVAKIYAPRVEQRAQLVLEALAEIARRPRARERLRHDTGERVHALSPLGRPTRTTRLGSFAVGRNSHDCSFSSTCRSRHTQFGCHHADCGMSNHLSHASQSPKGRRLQRVSRSQWRRRTGPTGREKVTQVVPAVPSPIPRRLEAQRRVIDHPLRVHAPRQTTRDAARIVAFAPSAPEVHMNDRTGPQRPKRRDQCAGRAEIEHEHPSGRAGRAPKCAARAALPRAPAVADSSTLAPSPLTLQVFQGADTPRRAKDADRVLRWRRPCR